MAATATTGSTPTKQPDVKHYRKKIRALQLPGPRDAAQLVHDWPEGAERGNASAGASGNVIYDPERMLGRQGLAHESFHLLDNQSLTDANHQLLMRRMGLKPGEWSTGTGLTKAGLNSPSEIAADWFAAAKLGLDPRKQWEASYATGRYMPTRRKLLRFARTVERLGKSYSLPAYRRPR